MPCLSTVISRRLWARWAPPPRAAGAAVCGAAGVSRASAAAREAVTASLLRCPFQCRLCASCVWTRPPTPCSSSAAMAACAPVGLLYMCVCVCACVRGRMRSCVCESACACARVFSLSITRLRCTALRARLRAPCRRYSRFPLPRPRPTRPQPDLTASDSATGSPRCRSLAPDPAPAAGRPPPAGRATTLPAVEELYGVGRDVTALGGAGCAGRIWEGVGAGRRRCPLCRRDVAGIVRVVGQEGDVVLRARARAHVSHARRSARQRRGVGRIRSSRGRGRGTK